MNALTGGRETSPADTSGVAGPATLAQKALERLHAGTLSSHPASAAAGVSAALAAIDQSASIAFAHAGAAMRRMCDGAIAGWHGAEPRLRAGFAQMLTGLAGVLHTAARMAWQAPPAVKAGVAMVSLIPIGWHSLAAAVTEEPAPAFRMVVPETDIARPAESWRVLAAPFAAYHLESPDLGRNAPLYRVRTSASGGRQDILQWGEASLVPAAGKGGLAGSVVVERRGGTSAGDTLFVETARRAALAGVSIGRMAQSLELETKFGMAEIAETDMEAAGKTARCQVFRVAGGPDALRINGWFCGAGQSTVSRDSLGCLIDRIDLISSGNDKELRAWFAASERSRKTCGASRAVSVKPSPSPAGARTPQPGPTADLRLKLFNG